MSEGWQDWPILGPGWKRRTAVRKSGASSGQSDTYYQSPCGQRFRSRNELSKFLGESVDLSWFDFKKGTVLPAEKRKPLRKYNRTPKASKSKTNTQPKSKPTPPPPPAEPEPDLPNGKEEEEDEESSRIACCSGCGAWFTGVEFGKSKQTVWFCAECRASRRAFNKQQKLLKNSGCGTCTACRVTENCGHCSVCLLRSQNPEFGNSWKCVRRRCLLVIRKGGVCGRCPGCCVKEDCRTCTVCIRKRQNPDQEISAKCLKRWCHNTKQKIDPPESKTLTKKLNLGGNCGVCPGCCTLDNCGICSLCVRKQQNPGRKIKGKCVRRRCHNKKKKIKVKPRIGMKGQFAGRRKNRKCGECEACLKHLDCGECDFCQDKPKFGGRNLKRQKCRWRQCLRFAVEKNIPLYLKSSNHPIIQERIQKEAAEAAESMEVMSQDEEVQLPPRIPVIRLALKNGGYPSADGTRGGWVIGEVDTSVIRQDVTIIDDDDDDQPLDLHCPVKSQEYITEEDDLEIADDNTPVIMEIYSLGDYNESNNLDRVLQEFMEELNEIPLPAHWEVLPPTGPNLHLIQRSRISTMSETVIYILPGLHFNIAVRNYNVPSYHELFSKHPSRLTTVDEVVELICDLEAYRPCAGLPKSGPPSPNCWVLVYEERCPDCCTMPWPSGNYH